MDSYESHNNCIEIIKSSGTGLFIYDLKDEKYKWYNEKFMELLGIDNNTKVNNVNKIINSKIHPKDELFSQEVYKHESNDYSDNYHSLFRIKNNSDKYQWLLATMKEVNTQSSDSCLLIGFIIDITSLLHHNNQLLKAIKEIKKENHRKVLNSLTKREKQVTPLFIKGYTYKEISEQLCLSPHTIIKHKRNIFRKTNTNNIKELICFAYEAGLK